MPFRERSPVEVPQQYEKSKKQDGGQEPTDKVESPRIEDIAIIRRGSMVSCKNFRPTRCLVLIRHGAAQVELDSRCCSQRLLDEVDTPRGELHGESQTRTACPIYAMRGAKQS